MTTRRPHTPTWGVAALVASAALGYAHPSGASPDYPAAIQNELALGALPRCTLCHSSDSGGTGTVVTALGLALQTLGARGQDPASLERAVARDRDEDLDSDGDGIADIAELTFGSDPSDGPGRAALVAPPQHGCSLGLGAPDRGRGALTWLLAWALCATLGE